MLTPNCTEEVFNDAQQIFEMLNQAAEIAHKMNEKIREANGDMSRMPVLEPPPTFSICLDDPVFRELYPLHLQNYVYPVQQLVNEEDDCAPNPLVAPNGSTVRPVGDLFSQPPVPSFLQQLWLNANPESGPTAAEIAEQDFENYEKARKSGGNIWAMPLPRRTFIPSRLRYATGIDLNRKLQEMREREHQAIAEEIRKLTLSEFRLNNVEVPQEEEEPPADPKTESKNKKKKNAKRNKKNKAKELQKEQPLRHRDP